MNYTATNYDNSHDRHLSADEAASERERTQWLRRTSWGAILAGAVSAIGLQALFTVLGAAIGASSFSAYGSEAQNVGAFAGIWWVVSGTISLLVGGIIVGRMISIPRNAELVVHGFTMWAVTAVFGFLFIWSSAGMIGNAGSQLMDDSTPIQLAAQTVDTDSATQRGTAGQGRTAGASRASAEDVRETASSASWWTFIALLLGVGASLGGTYIGSAPLGPKDNHDAARRPSAPSISTPSKH